MKRKLFFLIVFLTPILFFSCSVGLDSAFGYTDDDYTDTYKAAPSTPVNLSATTNDSTVYLTWDSVSNATYYVVYYSSSAYGTYTAFSDTVTSANCTINNVSSGSHYYKVQACNSYGKSELSTYKYVYVDDSDSYGSFSDVPSGALRLTVDSMDGSYYSWTTKYISTSEYQYYYFYVSSGTRYYITWYDKYCCPDQLDTWGYYTHADIYVGGSFSGAQDDITNYVDGVSSNSSYGYAYNTMSSSGYYVLKVKASASGYYGIRVSTSLP